MVFTLPGHIFTRHDRRGAEAKANLHNIQLSVERFAVDHGGCYPQYLIGGEPGSAGADWASDPLLREGYIDSYPRNPFARPADQPGKLEVLEVQRQLSKSTIGSDPLRPGSPEGDKYGYRFGKDGGTMGQVLCDARWPTWTREDPATGEPAEQPTWADVEYRFWDVWLGNKPLPYSPGQFFYKGIGPVIAHTKTGEESAGPVILPTEIDQYMLGIYGDLRSKGKDILGGISDPLELPVGVQDGDSILAADPVEFISWFPRTGSTLDPEGREGNPYTVPTEDVWGEQMQYGNPNGVRDGIILVLTAGEDFIGER